MGKIQLAVAGGCKFPKTFADPYSLAVEDQDYGCLGSYPPTILLVEDNPADVLLLRIALVDNDVDSQIFLARDGAEALSFADEVDLGGLPCPAIAVVDLNLPMVSGLKVLARLRASSRCGHIPIAILTTSSSLTEKEEAARLGANCFLQKPMDLDGFTALASELKRLLPE